MERVVVEIEWAEHNFAAHAPALKGCVATGDTPEEVKKNISEAIKWHVESSLEDGDPIPDIFKGEYLLSFKFDTMSLLQYYKGILGNKGVERLTGINSKQLNHYATGHRQPSERTKKKIAEGIHAFGRELIAVQL